MEHTHCLHAAGSIVNVTTPSDAFGPYTPEAINKSYFEVIGTLQANQQLQQMQCVDFGDTFGASRLASCPTPLRHVLGVSGRPGCCQTSLAHSMRIRHIPDDVLPSILALALHECQHSSPV